MWVNRLLDHDGLYALVDAEKIIRVVPILYLHKAFVVAAVARLTRSWPSSIMKFTYAPPPECGCKASQYPVVLRSCVRYLPSKDRRLR